jgi:RNA polymerase sigma factor (sigma-70 family)
MWDDLPPWHKLKQGDEDAWQKLFEQLWHPVFYFAKHRCGTLLADEDAAEATQDAFIQLVEHLARSGREPRIASWLRKTVRRRLLDRVRRVLSRKRGSGETVSLDEITAEAGDCLAMPPRPPNGLSASEVRSLAENLCLICRDLDEVTSVLLVEKHCNQERYEDLAKQHSLTPGNIASKLSRGLNALRTAIERNPNRLQEIRVLLRYQ